MDTCSGNKLITNILLKQTWMLLV